MIRFILKIAILFLLICLVLSFFLPQQPQNTQDGEAQNPSILSSFYAVSAFFQDMKGFCVRNPQSCETGKNFFSMISEKTQQGASFVYQWLANSFTKGAKNTQENVSNSKAHTTQNSLDNSTNNNFENRQSGTHNKPSDSLQHKEPFKKPQKENTSPSNQQTQIDNTPSTQLPSQQHSNIPIPTAK